MGTFDLYTAAINLLHYNRRTFNCVYLLCLCRPPLMNPLNLDPDDDRWAFRINLLAFLWLSPATQRDRNIRCEDVIIVNKATRLYMYLNAWVNILWATCTHVSAPSLEDLQTALQTAVMVRDHCVLAYWSPIYHCPMANIIMFNILVLLRPFCLIIDKIVLTLSRERGYIQL